MDCQKVGELILKLRKEKHMTQRQIAEKLNISDKTVSKWERGLGCPDISILCELSDLLGVNIEKILIGDLNPKGNDGGNMRRIKFYICSCCGNVITSTSEATISCCGRILEPLVPRQLDDEHKITTEHVENDLFITIDHEMTKAHYISFVAYVAYDRVLLIKLYPEQDATVRFPNIMKGKLYIYCNKDGLMVK